MNFVLCFLLTVSLNVHVFLVLWNLVKIVMRHLGQSVHRMLIIRD
jgi:hypothetical protein